MSELLPSRQNERYGACGNGGPGEAQRQRVRRGEEEQRSDCAFRPQGGNKGCGACDDVGILRPKMGRSLSRHSRENGVKWLQQDGEAQGGRLRGRFYGRLGQAGATFQGSRDEGLASFCQSSGKVLTLFHRSVNKVRTLFWRSFHRVCAEFHQSLLEVGTSLLEVCAMFPQRGARKGGSPHREGGKIKGCCHGSRYRRSCRSIRKSTGSGRR